MNGVWVQAEVRDAVIDQVGAWSAHTGLPVRQLGAHLGISRSRFYDWRRRYGCANAHNAQVPRSHWLEDWERAAIIEFYGTHDQDGYRRVTYMMLDANVVAVSPSSVYRVLKRAGRLRSWDRTPAKKGTGFHPPSRPHEHWHMDISYINICGTFYYLCSVLDGFSRFIIVYPKNWTGG